DDPPPGWGLCLRWIALAFVPSSLLIGSTTYITTDIAAVPLLWVMPLAIYLLTFILAFGPWPARMHRAVVAGMGPFVLVAFFLMLSGFKQRIWIPVLWHFLLLFVVALACHGELALTRPPARHLTQFYLLLSVGGVLGGLASALIAPMVLRSLLEYPLVMALGCLLVGHASRGRARRRHAGICRALGEDVALASAVGAGLVLFSDLISVRIDTSFFTRLLRISSATVAEWVTPAESTARKLLVYGTPVAALLFLRRRPAALALGLVLLLGVGDFVDAR